MFRKRPLFLIIVLLCCLYAVVTRGVKAGVWPSQQGDPAQDAGPVAGGSLHTVRGNNVAADPTEERQAEGRLANWTPLAVADDPLVRMPGTQPDQGVELVGPNQCHNCHADFDPLTEPFNNWQGSMMAQSARDFLYWPTLTVAAQDAIWALGNPNATDFCLRCHMPGGWLGGRSDPTNGSAMTGIDFDGVQCNLCHYLYDPFFETTYAGTREGDDWEGYWDEFVYSDTTLSYAGALELYNQDSSLAAAITNFNGTSFYNGNLPPAGFTENGAGQMFVSTLSDNRRASFADANANHAKYYSRYHKSKYFCSTCHDISNPLLANLGADPTAILPTELNAAYSYYHVERTFSEFILSDFGEQGGAAGIGPYDPAVFDTSQPNDVIATCQDCHMQDQVGRAADKNRAILRPTDSTEHPKSGVPQHDLTGGNMWVSYILASTDPESANYDATNDTLLNQGSATLTMDLTSGDAFDPASLLAGVDRAEQNLLNAAAIENVNYSIGDGSLSFQVQNQTGHKLISGYPEGRRMFLNIRYFDGETLLLEVNPYDAAAGTLKGLSGYTYSDPDNILPSPVALGANERYVDELVYEMHGSSTITGEDETFHFALSNGRYKDNRIPPMGFRIDEADERLSEPVWHGVSAPDYFTSAEYDGGYDQVNLSDYGITVPGADKVEIALFYQTTSREYIEFLRNEIIGTDAYSLTLTGTGAGGDPPYIIQTDPFFSQLKAWGDTIWDLWRHNKDVPGGAPVTMVTATIVGPPNTPPVAVTDTYTTTEDVPLPAPSPGVLGNDSDADGDSLTAVKESDPAFGQLNFKLDGSFVYTPALNVNGADSFTYHAFDGVAASNSVVVTLTITADNDLPTATADVYSTPEDTTLVVPAPGVLSNDDDVDGDELTAISDSDPLSGTLQLNLDGSFVYTPSAEFIGSDTFSYHAYDGQANSGTVVVTLTVTAENDAPVAAADSYTTAEDDPLVVSEAEGVLANDTDVDGDTLSAYLDSVPVSGTLKLELDGSFVYTPALNFNGVDTFTYHANDGLANSNTTVVTLTVTDENDAPVAATDSYTTTEDITLFVSGVEGVLANDSDVDGDTLNAHLDSAPMSGTLKLNLDGSFIYTPALNFNGVVTFTYHAQDPAAASSNVATTALTVTAVNDAPVDVHDTYASLEDMTLVVPEPQGILANDIDVDGDTLTAHLDSGPQNGTLFLHLDGSFVYTPALNFNGIDTFTYHANDGQADSNTAVVTLTVTAVNDAPVTAADHYTGTRNSTLTVLAPGVLKNDQDVEGDQLDAHLVTGPLSGTLELRLDGSFLYTPTQGFAGRDSFTYYASDGQANSEVVTVTLTIKAINEAPLAVGDSYTTNEDDSLLIPAPGLLQNDSDPDGNPLTAFLESGPSKGVLDLNPDGSFVYTPTLNYYGVITFTYQASDGLLDSDPATVTITVTAVNDAPVASSDSYTTTENITLVVSSPKGVLFNDDDVEDDSLTAVLVSSPKNGTLFLSPDGSFVYTPTAGFYGADSFTYRADDGQDSSDPVSVTLLVIASPRTYLYLPIAIKS